MRLTSTSPVRPASALRPRSWGFIVRLVASLLALTPFALAAQVEGTWTATLPERVIRGTPVTETGTIRFAADGSYTAERKWTWVDDDNLRTGVFAFAEGTWEARADTLCVQREDVGRAACQPFAVTGDTLRWGAFTFIRGE